MTNKVGSVIVLEIDKANIKNDLEKVVFKNIIEYEGCPLCGSTRCSHMFTKKLSFINLTGEIVKCGDCSFIYSLKYLSPEGTKAFYDLKYKFGNYKVYSDHLKIKSINFESSFNRIMSIVEKNEPGYSSKGKKLLV